MSEHDVTEYTIKTTDPEEVKLYLNAHHMASKIEFYYSECLRSYIKHGFDAKGNGLTEREYALVEEIVQKLNDYFNELDD